LLNNGLEDISLDVAAAEGLVWELLFNLVHWGQAVCGYMGVAVSDCDRLYSNDF
jgi:hypothetical protein